MTPTQQHTFEFGKGIVEVRNAATRFEVLIKDMNAKHTAKKMLNDWVRMLKRIQSDLKQAAGSEAFRTILEEQLMNDEDTLQVNAVMDYMLALPKQERNKVEEYAERLVTKKNNNMKLELKHLAPYLPYSLKVIVGGTKRDLTAISLDSNLHYVTAWQGSREKQMVWIENIKPILRPLSDLTQKMLRDAGFWSHVDYLTHELQNHLARGGELSAYIKHVTLKHYNWIIENHFDFFGLIPAGLAIDINTLNK